MTPLDLQELYVHWNPINHVAATAIARSFPNLKTLSTLKIDDQALRVLYIEMPYLEKLVMFEAAATEEGISGTSTDIALQILENGQLQDVDPALVRKDLSIVTLSSKYKLRAY